MKLIEVDNLCDREDGIGARLASSLLWIILLCNVSMSVYQLFYNRSLWYDEAFLALNIINRDYLDLLKPLDHNQVAPIGFLFIQKFFANLFGGHDWSLRIIPYINFVASIPVLYFISKKLTNYRLVALIAVSIFSANFWIIKFATEVKQYSGDILIALVILFYSLIFNNDKSKIYQFSIIGAGAIWFSNIAVVLLFVSGLFFLYHDVYKDKNYSIFIALTSWVFSFTVFYSLFLHNHPTEEAMVKWWMKRNAFLPIDLFPGGFFDFLTVKLKDIYKNILGFGALWQTNLLLSVVGIIIAVKHRNYALIYFCLMPIGVHLILSGLRLYPFHLRLILYLMPMLIILYAYGLYGTLLNLKLAPRQVMIFVMTFPTIILAYQTYAAVPYEKEGIKKSIAYMITNIKENDAIYVYYGATPAYRFYEDKNQISNKVVWGQKHRGHQHRYVKDISQLHGRFWLLFSHVHYQTLGNEEDYIISKIKANGAQIIDKKRYIGSSVYYVDMHQLFSNREMSR